MQWTQKHLSKTTPGFEELIASLAENWLIEGAADKMKVSIPGRGDTIQPQVTVIKD